MAYLLMTYLRITAAALLLAISACTTQNSAELNGQPPSSGEERLEKERLDEEPVDKVLSGEKLLAAPPAGWNKIYGLNNGTTRLTDFVPPNQSKAEWSTKLSFESHDSLTDINPIAILMGDLENLKDICEPIQSFNLFSGEENNYPTSVRLTFCGKNAHSSKGEVSISKVIQGNDYLYIVKMIHQVEPYTDPEAAITKEEIAVWSQYFREITLCDSRLETHPCPIPADE